MLVMVKVWGKTQLIVLLLCLSQLLVYCQNGRYNFLKVNTSNGLSHNQVNAILKDSYGFLWFGTMSGLNRYDGNSIKIFKKKIDDSTSLKDNLVQSLSLLPAGKIWVTTRSGACIYNSVTEKFEPDYDKYLQTLGLPISAVKRIYKLKNGFFAFLYNNGDVYLYSEKNNSTRLVYKYTSSEVKERITALQQADESKIWMVLENGVLKLFDLTKNLIVKSCNVLKDLRGDNLEYDLQIDSDGDVWVWNYLNGLYWIRPTNNDIKWFNEKKSLRSNLVSQVVQDNEGKVWVGTDHGGINIIDKKNNFSTTYIFNDPQNPKSLSQNSVTSLYKDESGILWVGTYKQGVNFFNSSIAQFPLYRHQEGNSASLPYDDVNRFAEDKYGNIWIGTNGGGLIYFNRKSNNFTQYIHNPQDKNSLCADVVVSLCVDHDNNLWVGTYLGGLDMFDGKKFTHYTHREGDYTSISSNSIWEIFEDSEQNLWIGTLGDGLDRFEKTTNTFRHYKASDTDAIISSNIISAILQDKKGNIWFGTDNGLAVFNTKSQLRLRYATTTERNSLSHNTVVCLEEDYKGRIWIGTFEGLNVFNPETQKFQNFTVKDGLPDNVILNAIEDEHHTLWISTPNGLCNAIPVDSNNQLLLTIINYDEINNLQNREFNDNAAFRTKQNEIFFGGVSGFNIIDPLYAIKKINSPAVVITGLQLYNNHVEPGELINGRILLQGSISLLRNIELKHKENYFSIQFASLDFSHSIRDKYGYMLKGFNNEWITTDGNQRSATYTNLAPGHYTFMVKVMQRNGRWSEVKTLEIDIAPPFWRTNLAYFLYVLFFLGLALLARKIILDRIHMRYQVVEQRKEAERKQVIEQLKTKFFTNVSHEFRTPLSLIIAPLDKLIKHSVSEEQKIQLGLVQRNAKRLLGLVNQLLDFRKIQVQEMKLHPSFGDIIDFIRGICHSFLDIAENKRIEFSFTSEIEHLEMYFDRDKLEKIMFNLLSNAFKYTQDAGKVCVRMFQKPVLNHEQEGVLSIEVEDTGIGIAAENQDKIFERFFQTDLPDSMVNQGTGIGLAITKEFVKLHKGVITVNSALDQGTRFTILLPVKKSPDLTGRQNIVSAVPLDGEMEESVVINTSAAEDKRKRTKLILLVEDNEDMRFYLKDNLKSHYQVLEAANGKVAWEIIQKMMPDLVVSDVMMPEMTGLELAKKIKAERQTAHIPVILLTAVGNEEKQLEGFQIGVNDYITKPFTFEILASRIKNIIAQQSLLHSRFQKQIEVNPKEITITPVDEKFIKDALEIVEKNLDDSDFSVEDFSNALFMNRVTLYRKLVSVTGKTPIEFIRTIRLKRAAFLLAKSGKTVAEIAYETGFNNPKKFAKFFQEEFNVLPSQYHKNISKNEDI